MKSSTRVIVNTFAQYVRTIVTAIVTLYTSRVVLSSLGIDDFGIYSLVAGVVGMLSFIQNNLSSASQRFLSYHQGRNDQAMVVKVFNNSVCTQLIISLLLCILLALFTQPVFTHLVNIPTDKLHSAYIVYWLMLVSLFFNMMSTPYLAALIARENIVFSSIIQIVDAFIKVPLVISLTYIDSDRLEWYAFMMMGITVFNFLCYYIYGKLKYEECRHFSFTSFDGKLCREMMSFMGWYVYGTVCIVGRTQGVAILLNNFFTTAINAAYGIAGQVSGQLSFLSGALTTAFRPRIIKTEGEGSRQKMFRLSEKSCKFSFLLMTMVAVPMVMHINDILSLWLTEVPQYTALFCIAFLLANTIDSLTVNMTSANAAIGKVKVYTLFVNTTKFMTVPAALCVLFMGGTLLQVMVVYIVFEFICSVIRVLFLHYTVNLSISSYLHNVLYKSIVPVTINSLVCYYLADYCLGFWFLLTCTASVAITSITTYLFALNDDEKIIIDSIMIKFIKRQ